MFLSFRCPRFMDTPWICLWRVSTKKPLDAVFRQGELSLAQAPVSVDDLRETTVLLRQALDTLHKSINDRFSRRGVHSNKKVRILNFHVGD